MNILVAFEESGETSERLRAQGHTVTSVDLKPSAINSPFHVQGDAREVIASQPWDMIIMHPPCTALAVSGNRWYGKDMPKHQERLDSIEWTMEVWELAKKHADRVAMENPVGVLPIKASQYVQPWQFGHGECKKTGWWLHNLPLLKPTDIVSGREQKVWRMGPSPKRAELRSKTYPGMAQAIAEQWGK